ncbi:hypothetical protein PJ267_18295 [Arthrobacter sp. OVS8]|nr:hypothetical protein PJ267_18295 [Arthrobacter sp. OVS8]
MGTHSAGETSGDNYAIATTLEDALTRFPTAVELQLFLNKPELVAPENLTYTAGQPITGRVPAAPASAVPANSKVRITAGTQETDVPVDGAGNWSFRAPLPVGPLTFSSEAVNGFSRSGAANFTVDVAPSALQAPEITTATGAALPALNSIDGTGMSGAIVTLAGDVSGSGTVGLDGHWTVPLAGQAAVGKVTVTATLSSPGIADSPSTIRTFTLAPGAPAVSSLADGAHLSQDTLPGTIAGTGVDGADVAVLIDGVSVGATQAGTGGAAAGGRWSVPFPEGLTTGAHTLSVTQSVDGVASDPRLVAFTIDAPVSVPAEPNDPAGPGVPAEPGLPADPGLRRRPEFRLCPLPRLPTPPCFLPAPASCRPPARVRSCQ